MLADLSSQDGFEPAALSPRLDSEEPQLGTLRRVGSLQAFVLTTQRSEELLELERVAHPHGSPLVDLAPDAQPNPRVVEHVARPALLSWVT